MIVRFFFFWLCRGSSSISFMFLLSDLNGLRLMSSVLHHWNTSLDVFDTWNGKKMQICFKVVLYSPFGLYVRPFTGWCFPSFGTLVLISVFRKKGEYLFLWNLWNRVHIQTFLNWKNSMQQLMFVMYVSRRICNHKK